MFEETCNAIILAISFQDNVSTLCLVYLIKILFRYI